MHINILYSSNENYTRHAATSLYSLLENNTHINEISIYFIDDNITEESKKKLQSVVNSFKRQIYFIPIESLLVKFKKRDDFPLSGYARLFISNKFTNVDKILYLDCDTVVAGSLEELWNTDIEGYLVAGVQDNPAMYMSEIIGMNRKSRYINSGVMLMNLKYWREWDIENKIIDFVNKFRGEVPHHDQGLINGICKDKILILHPKYNMMPQFLLYNVMQIKSLYNIENYYTQQFLDEATKTPVIVHYISKFYDRPWFTGCTHPMKGLYTDYLSKTTFDNKIYPSNQSYKVKLRKWVYSNLPFLIFGGLEKFLDIKRRRYISEKYNYLNIL
ncbi:glycosyltransferase family 8 protein [Priestia megaterium]|uniref:glycosyltransferase family 8 protein n=1 Tax=Priestia megaterium TaxID=1404 RepID=UPI00301BE8EF